MTYVIYFVKEKQDRYINTSLLPKVIIGNNITNEGYYVGKLVERSNCFIFSGIPFIPTENDIPSFVNFNPYKYHEQNIVKSTIRYFLVKHKKSGAYFVMCRYKFDDLNKPYFADLIAFINLKLAIILPWPFQADKERLEDRLRDCLQSYNNFYEKDFEIVRKLNGLCDPKRV